VGPVTEQSEHLSSAQIENYGNRTSGTGPGSAQADEHQRVDHQTSDDQTISEQRVEAHLADCPSCRNRLLDFHRSYFALLAQPAGAGSTSYSPGPANSKLTDAKPMGSALADSKFANSKYPVQTQVRTVPTPECPSEDTLRQLAAGLTPEDVAAKLTQHVATCDHCGPLLRNFTEDFSDDFTPEEQAALANLQSSSAAWQKNTARQMMKVAGATAANAGDAGLSGAATTIKSDKKPSAARAATSDLGRKPFFWKWVLVPATAVIVAVAAFSIWYAQRDTPEKVEKLLAQAYTEQRTIEMRIPYAVHANFKQTRSGDSQSRFNSPVDLSRAAEKISVHLKKDPDDPQWLILSARLDLLDWNYKPALSSLEKISDANVAESPEFLMTQAFALYERSEVLKESQGYFEAVNLLAKALQKTPDNSVLLFNQAIACEKIHAYECAQGDWNRFLTIEKDPGWTSEAHKHLQQIEEKKTLAP
jgi:hypothetical protein